MDEGETQQFRWYLLEQFEHLNSGVSGVGFLWQSKQVFASDDAFDTPVLLLLSDAVRSEVNEHVSSFKAKWRRRCNGLGLNFIFVVPDG